MEVTFSGRILRIHTKVLANKRVEEVADHTTVLSSTMTALSDRVDSEDCSWGSKLMADWDKMCLHTRRLWEADNLAGNWTEVEDHG